jgi:hypothetical protein
LRAWFRLIAEVLWEHVRAAASFGSDPNAEGLREVQISFVVTIHWDQAALLRRLTDCGLRSHQW